MYTKEQASAIRQKFWTTFGLYMQLVPCVTGKKISWINYHTGIKGISFKMNADNESASICIIIPIPNIN